ncbi:MAG: prolipoprotein diacylglyceryl transferase [Bacteroidia bacterium]|nr:prolipoprotein diacylglyceryl transferase [Bacteroidia bacterium]
MMPLNFITWDVDPVIFSIGQFSLRWYGTLFAGGFFLGYMITQRVWRREKEDESQLDTLLILLVLGALLGSRLGHVFFYQWDYYSQHPEEILAVWKGGLASHGGAIGLIVVFWIFSKFFIKKPLLWVTDRVVMSVALTAGMIRTGNLMNSEILGSPTDLPWAFIFTMRDEIPRHPAQLYEALAYYSIAALLFYLFFKTPSKNNRGFITGVFLAMTFTARVLLEFLKENQVPFEENMALNMGQWLSFPLIALGLYLIWGSRRIRI